MVKIRLQRFGSHKMPKYRIVACDSKSPRDGKFIEIIGTYNPKDNPATITVNKELAQKWLNQGAQMTQTIKDIFKKENICK